MAKIKLSSIGITNISGKAGGSIYTKNKGGTYFKNFVPASNPQSQAQTGVRGIFGSISAGWRNLTSGQRQGWRQSSVNFPYLDVFGDTKTLSGFNLYQQLNLNLVASGQAQISVAPQQKGVTSFAEGQTVQYDIETGTVMWGANFVSDNPEDVGVILQMTGPVSPGINSFGTRYRQVYKFLVTANSGSAPNSLGANNTYDPVFGIPPVGANIGARGRIVNNIGETSPWVKFDATVIDSIP